MVGHGTHQVGGEAGEGEGGAGPGDHVVERPARQGGAGGRSVGGEGGVDREQGVGLDGPGRRPGRWEPLVVAGAAPFEHDHPRGEGVTQPVGVEHPHVGAGGEAEHPDVGDPDRHGRRRHVDGHRPAPVGGVVDDPEPGVTGVGTRCGRPAEADPLQGVVVVQRHGVVGAGGGGVDGPLVGDAVVDPLTGRAGQERHRHGPGQHGQHRHGGPGEGRAPYREGGHRCHRRRQRRQEQAGVHEVAPDPDHPEGVDEGRRR